MFIQGESPEEKLCTQIGQREEKVLFRSKKAHQPRYTCRNQADGAFGGEGPAWLEQRDHGARRSQQRTWKGRSGAAMATELQRRVGEV